MLLVETLVKGKFPVNEETLGESLDNKRFVSQYALM